MNFFVRALVIGPRGISSGSVTCAAVSIRFLLKEHLFYILAKEIYFYNFDNYTQDITLVSRALRGTLMSHAILWWRDIEDSIAWVIRIKIKTICEGRSGESACLFPRDERRKSSRSTYGSWNSYAGSEESSMAESLMGELGGCIAGCCSSEKKFSKGCGNSCCMGGSLSGTGEKFRNVHRTFPFSRL